MDRAVKGAVGPPAPTPDGRVYPVEIHIQISGITSVPEDGCREAIGSEPAVLILSVP
jgi:hypothetical protein